MSSPRAATSVATSTCSWPLLKPASAWLRRPWLSSPWNGCADTPALCSFSARLSAPRWLATNTSACGQASLRSRCRSSAVRCVLSTSIARWRIVAGTAAAASSPMRRGPRSRRCASPSTAAGKVAENSSVCRRRGSSARIRPSSASKPSASRRSASSSTSVRTAPRSSALCAARSSRRPGVATTMSAPPRSFSICGLIEAPPATAATLMRRGR